MTRTKINKGRQKRPSQVVCFLACILLLGCTSTRKQKNAQVTKVNRQWSLGEVRNAVQEVLSFYGPVKKSTSNDFQSSRVPTNVIKNMGQEYTVATVRVGPSHPHEVTITSIVYVVTPPKGFVPAKGNKGNPDLEKEILSELRSLLSQTDQFNL